MNELKRKLIRRAEGSSKASRRAHGGFTLVELLVTLLIVVMLTIMASNGIAAGQRTYATVRDVSNAQVALSTTTAALRNELGSAVEMQSDSTSGGSPYYRTVGGLWVRIVLDEEGSRTLQKRYYQRGADGSFAPVTTTQIGDDGQPTQNPVELVISLIPEEALPDNMRVVWGDGSVNYSYDTNTKTWTVKGPRIVRQNGEVLAQIGELGTSPRDYVIKQEYGDS